jgi:hypothetical protein
MKKNKVLQSTFISTAVLFALARPFFAEINDGVVNFSNAALGLSQPPITTFDAPGAGTDPGEGTRSVMRQLPFATRSHGGDR